VIFELLWSGSLAIFTIVKNHRSHNLKLSAGSRHGTGKTQG